MCYIKIFFLVFIFVSPHLLSAQSKESAIIRGALYILSLDKDVNARSHVGVRPMSQTLITDIHSLKDMPDQNSVATGKDETGRIVSNAKSISQNGAELTKGLCVWNGKSWENIYNHPPAGGFLADLQALWEIQNHPDNKGAFKMWTIDFDNAENIDLPGVVFEEINGEPRVVKLLFVRHNVKNITITKGLEAVAWIQIMNATKLKEINLNCPSLVRFDCSSSALKTINLSNHPQLGYVRCRFNNKLAALDISGNAKLAYLWCDQNKLEKLNISGNKSLTNLACYTNSLKSLDLSDAPLVNTLRISDNPMRETSNSIKICAKTYKRLYKSDIKTQEEAHYQIVDCE